MSKQRLTFLTTATLVVAAWTIMSGATLQEILRDLRERQGGEVMRNAP